MQQCCVSHQVQLWLLLLLLCVAYCGADILVFSAGTRYQVDDEFRDMPARFGGFIPSEGIKGMVVYAQPPTACHEIQGPPNDTSYEGNWIVLIARYECKFEIKVRMAQKAGYDAAIIHNVNSNELEPMSAEDPIGIQIPSVFVSELTGLIIKENYLYDQLYFVLINDDLPFNINTHLLLPFAIVVGICFLVMVIFMIVRCIKDRRRQLRHRLPNSSLNKIPTHKYTKGDPYETCAICLDDYTEGEKLRVLPCAHAYHSKCIDPWLTKNRRVCPVCKRKVFAADEQVVTDESDSDADDSTPLIRDGYQGTQGGTFIRQRENPFNRSRRTQHRQDTNNSSSGSDSESSSTSSDDDGSISTGEPSGGIVFMVSDSHSINGELQDLERSVSSTRPHTVNLYTETQEFPVPVVQITPARNTRVLVNSATLNPDHLAIAADNRSASTTSIDFEKNDVAA
ncbi:E3 ubiquitin-protein ligase RNF13-like isoform X1 [Vespula maculifrons]|uniref:RING-type E3 ubiquitin transferase n=1 Tax=Vespula maculifrons TaxID=7453 RepID=A0ABD2ALU8_VESMC|nr:E3 ubiquitin-protein ligase RNF13-like isoform X1 [Vespula vulgaris]XP_050848683.1 E3 ubiquitin-protein ligase RNF13-like isoform X1 [Vespula vulgaris]XP_050848684.1 E3 ubiquitin-protein ligase RNF13-like isoform X1 [Vespula vulgaris]XP_050848685.1 E3 ubiquitin-protein ligase RNF13-like isoform X1 [Vespula vulgaris]XP_050848686.1 E3 ubiquitin-protein ligase RNF13-like isoform X1 [Vespula vulgaris]XP_050848687.1 E3 ubiquitin-protein ligase RNF13-like isoform X1 [Vespula vulgaris]XP_05084868